MTTCERLRRHLEYLRSKGYRRITAYVSPQTLELLERNRERGEKNGALLDRLLLAQAPQRPPFHAGAELEAEIRRARNQIEHSTRPQNRKGPILLSVKLPTGENCGVEVTAGGVFRYGPEK